MRPAVALVALYPPGVRDRWGQELRAHVARAGIRSWPDTLAGALRLWLNPSDWPETVVGQTRRVVAVMLFALTAGAALVVRAAASTLTAYPARPLTNVWLVPVLLGLALAAPLPRFDSLRRPGLEVLRVLPAPVGAIVALFGVAYSGLAEHPVGALKLGLVGYYWATLGFVASRICALVARLSQVAAAPSMPRLRIALLLTGCGAGLGAGQTLLALVHLPTAGAAATVIALGVLAGATLRARHGLAAPQIDPASH